MIPFPNSSTAPGDDSAPRLIVGLGNPGKDYVGTRHNVGFELIDALASAHRIKVDTKAAKSIVGRGHIAGKPVVLAKPQTFMNLSGEAVALLLRRDNIPLRNLLIVMDEIHLPPGKIRLRAKGSSGGHNGLKSIASVLATQDWARLRLGVGEPPPGLQIDWVLGRFSRADRPLIDEMLIVGMGAAEVFIADGIETAMNRFNGDVPL